MELIFLAALGVGALTILLGDDDPVPNRSRRAKDDGDGTPPPDDNAPPDEPSTAVFQVSDGATINGSGQADVFALSDDVDGFFTAEVNGGDGDDTFNLTRPDGSAFLSLGSLDGGAGNDVFKVSGERSNLRGGEGNDTVFGDLLDSSVSGEGGDDLLRVSAGPSGAALVFGGDGQDTLDGRGSENIVLEGGAGDDLIFSDGVGSRGAGYNIIARGGAGDDTLSHSVEVFPPPDSSNNLSALLTGGSGADTFNIIFQPGFAERAVAGTVVTITDFTQGEDSLSIDFPDLARAELVEDPDGAYSDINLFYQADDGQGGTVDRYLTVRLQGITGTTLDDLGITLPDPDPAQGRLYEIALGGLPRVEGGEGNDTIRGTADGEFFGGGGNDLFDIETGADSTLDGGFGNDVMTIGEGVNFTILGGAGNDTINADSTSNTQESSTLNGGDGDDRLNIDISLTDPFGQRVDTVSGGAGADVVTLNLATVNYGSDFTTDRMLVIADLQPSEDDLVINIRPEDAPFYKGATLVPNAQDGSTDLVLTFERTDTSGAPRSWTGVVKLIGTEDFVIADDGPIQIRTAA